ncbi:MAG: glycosyltransferase [Pyrinomonadaceae bacterium]
MARIVLSTTGSLGDLNPMIALALELRRRGHTSVINSWDGYREKIDSLGFEFRPLRPSIDPTDREIARRVMDARKGPEMVIKDLIFPNLHAMYDDLVAACDGADAMLNGEVIYVAGSVAETANIKWISTSLQPMSMFSSYDPNVYPTVEWMQLFRPMPPAFHDAMFSFLKWTISDWFEPFKQFRRDLGLSPNNDPVFTDKYSKLLHLAMFSKAIGKPQPDWFSPTLQTGFCFYDESETVTLPLELGEFLDAGEPPIVFTLGSAAVMDARDFFDESAKAAKMLGRRAVMLYGRDNEPPKGLSEDIVGFETAPYSLVFPKAACVVHQGGVGTTAQVLRAGVPHLFMPYAHDQPDNAARCQRNGVAEIISRTRYNSSSAAAALKNILGNDKYVSKASQLKRVIDSETGTKTACDAIEDILRK